MTPPLTELARHAEELPSLPEVVSFLMRTLKDESCDIDTIAHYLNSDPAIVARLLAAANCAASGLSTRIHSARQAFIVLGVDRVINLIMASTLAHCYDTRAAGFDSRRLWRHSIGVACCAKVLAQEIGFDPDLAFTGGLVHDIGQLLMFVASPHNYVRALELHQRDEIDLCAAERSLFGYDHSDAGHTLAQHWKLPSEIGEAIAAHHEPDEYGSEIGDLIHVSEVLSHALDLGEPPDNRVPELSELACANLGLSWRKLSGHFAEIETRYEGLRLALAI
jgi:putative nucleotidyltransferase with HDIG domain